MGSEVERATMINELYGMIRRRLEIFVNLPYASLDRMALKKRLDEIGDSARAPA
jgi:arsenate reductase